MNHSRRTEVPPLSDDALARPSRRRRDRGLKAGPAARLGLFALVLVAAFGAAAALGAGVDPGQSEPAADEMAMTGMGGVMGVAVSDDDYAITPAAFSAAPGAPTTISFRIVDHDGRVVRDGFQVEAERRMHLIVARRDLTGYQHLHPTQAADGTWSAPIVVPAAGVYRVFADFQRDGTKHVLAADLTVPGAYAPVPVPAPSASSSADGFQIAIQHRPLRAGKEEDLTFTLTRDGRPVDGIQPYLGARGHLVALRDGDLAYLHVHPHDEQPRTGQIAFSADFPSAGRFRLFLQFQVGGVVHTAPFTIEVTP